MISSPVAGRCGFAYGLNLSGKGKKGKWKSAV